MCGRTTWYFVLPKTKPHCYDLCSLAGEVESVKVVKVKEIGWIPGKSRELRTALDPAPGNKNDRLQSKRWGTRGQMRVMRMKGVTGGRDKGSSRGYPPRTYLQHDEVAHRRDKPSSPLISLAMAVDNLNSRRLDVVSVNAAWFCKLARLAANPQTHIAQLPKEERGNRREQECEVSPYTQVNNSDDLTSPKLDVSTPILPAFSRLRSYAKHMPCLASVHRNLTPTRNAQEYETGQDVYEFFDFMGVVEQRIACAVGIELSERHRRVRPPIFLNLGSNCNENVDSVLWPFMLHALNGSVATPSHFGNSSLGLFSVEPLNSSTNGYLDAYYDKKL
ncbi:hypothetical protein ACRALDRAFT_211626 [Sodiomyces alcalophilus JCM 7366]|uniref:uncharacterized protein n=1 Tax=Sodiomyces alcalophilus JCM 7366 TaxID=591952 RepID=UPI0039B62D7E